MRTPAILLIEVQPNQTVWRPNRKQAYFAALPDSIFEGFYGGSAFGGKSEILLYLPIVREFYKHPKFKGLILRRTFPELEREMIRRAKEVYPLTGAQPKDDGKTWQWASGAYLDFGHVEHESDVQKYDTAQYNYLAFDELTTFTEYIYTYLTHRCRSRSADLPAIVRSASNPGGVGHKWVRARFVEPCREGKVILQDSHGNKRIFVPAFIRDNVDGLKSDPTYAQRLELLPEAEKRAKRDGDWWTFTGQVFDDWRLIPFADEPPNARHVVDPEVIPWYCPRLLSIDWGYAAMLWAGWGAILPTKQLLIYREHACLRTKISTWGTEIGKLSDGEKITQTILCRSAWKQEGQEATIAQEFQKYSGLTPQQSNSDRIGGKILFQEYLRWRPKPSRREALPDFSPDVAEKILRIRGLDAYKNYCALYEPELPETNLPKLLVSKACPILIDTIPTCVYDKNDSSGKPAEDVAEFSGDDPYDGARYLVQAAHQYMENSGREHEIETSKNEVLAALDNKKIDMNSFYRKMEFLESKTRAVHKPIRLSRYGGRHAWLHASHKFQ